MAEYAYVGDTAYELIYRDDPPLTDAQAESLAAEYSQLGLPWRKAPWNGYNCVIAKAPPEAFSQFCVKRNADWQSIRDRVGYDGSTKALNNRYQPGFTQHNLGPEWDDVVDFIEANYKSRIIKRGGDAGFAGRPKKPWWRFW